MKKISLLILLLVIYGMLTGCSDNKREIIVGTKDYTEQYILGNILTLYIEENTDFRVTLKTDLASSIIFAAIRTGVVDVYVDYSGTIYGSYLIRSETKTPDEIFNIAASTLSENYALHMFDPLGFNNSYSLAVRKNTSEEYGLKTISDLAEVSMNFTFGASAEFLIRNDGAPNLKILYDMAFKEEIVVDGVHRYEAIANDVVQVTEAFTTDGHLLTHDLVILEDDKDFFPPYEGAVIIRDELLKEHPELYELLSILSGKISNETMRTLNYRVDVHDESPRDVAEYFLAQHNLIRR